MSKRKQLVNVHAKPDRNETMAEAIFYVVEGHTEKLQGWIVVHKDDQELVSEVAKAIEVALKNVTTLIQESEKRLTNFQSAIDLFDDAAESVEEIEEIETETESQ
jgi:predicted DNA-binding protein YlxM (UPF0122 family)